MLNEDKILVSDDVVNRMNKMFHGGVGSKAPSAQQGIDDGVLARMNRTIAGSGSVITPDSRMAMFPDEYVDENTDRIGAFERGYRSFASGFMSSIPGAMTQIGGIIDYLGADSAGEALTEQGMEWNEWINDHVAVENPTLANQIASGFGSLAFFMLPGLGSAGVASKTARGLGLVHKAGKSVGELNKAGRLFQTVFQAGTMATLEAAVEQSQRMEELIGQGQAPGEALKNSEGIFWQNMVMLTATNAPFFSPVGRLARAAMSGVSEGAQERMQSVIQEVASGRGQWSDFMDPNKHRNETIVGFITGGTVGGILPAEGGGKKDKQKLDTDDAEGFEGDLPPGFSENEQKMQELEDSGASDEELQDFAGLLLLESGLEREFGVQNINLVDLLSDEQVKELGADAAAAQNENDINKAVKMEEAVVEKAKDMLYRDGTAAKREGAVQSKDTMEAVEEELDAEADILIDEYRKERNALAQAGVDKAERQMGMPPRRLFKTEKRVATTPEEERVLASREASKAEYRKEKERKARLKDPTETEQQAIEDIPAGVLDGISLPTEEAPTTEEAVNIEDVNSELDATESAIARLGRKKKKTTKEKKLLKKLREKRNDLEAMVDKYDADVYEPLQAGILPEPGVQPAAERAEEKDTGPESADVFQETFPSRRPTLKDIHEMAKRKAIKDEQEASEEYRGSVPGESERKLEEDSGPAGGGRPDIIRANRGREADTGAVEGDVDVAKSAKKDFDEIVEKINGLSGEDLELEAKGESFKVLTAVEGFYAKHGYNSALSARVQDISQQVISGTFVKQKQAKKTEAPIEKIKKAAKKKAAKPSPVKTSKGVHLLPLGAIHSDPDVLQSRDVAAGTEFNEEVVQEAVDNFEDVKVGVITVWKDPADGKFKILDGHHTREILRRVGKKEAEVKIFKGSREDAIRLSEELNSTKQGVSVLDGVKIIRKLKDSGATKKSLLEKAKKVGRKNAKTLLAIAHLNPNGEVISALRSMQTAGEAELSTMMDMARWIGLARQNNVELTNAHEQEMFSDLKKNFKQKNGRRNQQEFSALIDNRTRTLAGFDSTKPLNLAEAVSRTPAQNEFDALLAEAKANSREASATLEAKRTEFVKKGVAGENMDKLLKPYNDAVTIATREELDIHSRKQGINRNVQGESTLFMGDTARTIRGEERYAVHRQDASNKQVLSEATDEANRRGVDIGEFVEVTRTDSASKVLRRIGKRFGVDVVFYKGTKDAAKRLGGFYTFGDKRIFINVKSEFPAIYILGHEIGHYLESRHKDAWNTINEAAAKSMRKGAREAYGVSREIVDDPFSGSSRANRELISDLVGEQFTKESFWNHLKALDSALWADLLNLVKFFLKNARRTISKAQFGMDVYFKNYAALEIVVRQQLAKVSSAEREGMKLKEDPYQGDLFDAAKPDQGTLFLDVRDPEMAEKVKEGDRQLKEVVKTGRRIRSGTDLARLVYQRMVDRNTFLYKAVKKVLLTAGYDPQTFDPTLNPYQSIRLMAGWANKAHQSLTDVVMSWDGKTELYKGLQRIIKDHGIAAGIENGEFGQFAQLLRMKAVYEVKGASYFTGDPADAELFNEAMFTEEQKEAKADFDKNMQLLKRYEKLEPGWEAAVKEISEWNRATLERAKQAGYLTENQFSDLVDKYELFVPMNVIKKDAGSASKIAYELGVYKAGVVRMDPIDSLIKKAYRMEFLIHINAAKVTAARLVEKLAGGNSSLKDFGRRVMPKERPLQDYIDTVAHLQGVDMKTADAETKRAITTTAEMYAAAEFEKDGVVALKRDGKIEYWQFSPDIMDVFTSQGGQQSQFWLKFFSAQTRMLRAGAILTPEFMATNQFRDFMGSMVLSKHLVKNPADFIQVIPRIIKGFNDALAHAQGKPVKTAQEYINSGAGNATFVSPDMTEIRKESSDLTKGQRFLRHKSPITILQEITNLFEYSTRFAVFRKTVDDLVASGVPYDQATSTAAIEARESSTDFSRMGEYGAVLNRIIPFFNAGIQGNDKLYRSMFVDKGRRSQTWAKGVILITAPSVALWAINHDEEWYKELPLYIKNHFWTFSFDGGKTIHKLPKPFEIGMIFGSLPERILDWHYDKDPRAMKEWATNFQKDLVPFDGLALLGPTMATLHEIESNFDVYRGTPIVKGYKADIMPREQYTSRTSEFAKVIGGAAPGKGVSPMMIDHFIRGTFGGLGTWGAEIASNVIMAAKPELRAKRRASNEVYGMAKDWWPIVRRVVAVGPPSYTRNMEDFFKEYDSARETYNTFTAFSSGGATRGQFEKLYLTDGKGLEQYKLLQNGMELAAGISKKMAIVEQSGSEVYSRKEKAKLLDKLQADRNKVFKDFMTEYHKVNWEDVQGKMDKKIKQVMSDFDRANGGI